MELSSIPRADENLKISSTTKGNRLGEHLGTTSDAVVSSTNFRRPWQSFNYGLTKIANRRGTKHVPGVNLHWHSTTRIDGNQL